MAYTACELKWLLSLLSSLCIPHASPFFLLSDSQSALHLAWNPVFPELTKHIEVDCHFVGDKILKKTIAPSYISTKTQLADLLTKAFGRSMFEDILTKLGISFLHALT